MTRPLRNRYRDALHAARLEHSQLDAEEAALRVVRDEAIAAERSRCARIAREYGAEKSSTIYGTANAVGLEIAELLVKA